MSTPTFLLPVVARSRKLAFALTFVGCGLLAQDVLGHSASFYTKRYSTDRGNIPIYFTRSAPTGAFRDRFKAAVDQWEAVH